MSNVAPVAQLDRASDYGSEGREFESSPAHQVIAGFHRNVGVCFFVVSNTFSNTLEL